MSTTYAAPPIEGTIHCSGRSHAFVSAEARLRQRDTSWQGERGLVPMNDFDRAVAAMVERTGESASLCLSLVAAQHSATLGDGPRSLAASGETTMSGLVSAGMARGLTYAAASAEALQFVRERSLAKIGRRR